MSSSCGFRPWFISSSISWFSSLVWFFALCLFSYYFMLVASSSSATLSGKGITVSSVCQSEVPFFSFIGQIDLICHPWSNHIDEVAVWLVSAFFGPPVKLEWVNPQTIPKKTGVKRGVDVRTAIHKCLLSLYGPLFPEGYFYIIHTDMHTHTHTYLVLRIANRFLRVKSWLF